MDQSDWMRTVLKSWDPAEPEKRAAPLDPTKLLPSHSLPSAAVLAEFMPPIEGDLSHYGADGLTARGRAFLTEVHAAQSEITSTNSARAAALRDSASNGGGFDPRELLVLLVTGSPEDRAAIRALFTSAEAIARNQDMVLPSIRAALDGVAEARAFIEQHRITVEENIAPWFKPTWDAEARAPWRCLDLHSKPVRRAATWTGGEVRDEYRTKWVLPLSLNPHAVSDRRSFLTYGIARALSNHNPSEDIKRIMGREAMYEVMRAEIEDDRLTISSPSVIGKFCRQVMLRELRSLFCAQLIDDTALALDLPLSDELKCSIWRYIIHAPWAIAKHPAIVRGPALAQELRAEGLVERELEEAFSRRLAMPVPQQRPAPETRANVAKPILRADESQPSAPEPAPSSAPRSKRLLFLAALQCFTAPSPEQDRYARVLAKLVGDDPHRFTSAMLAVRAGENPEQIIAQLRTTRPVFAQQRSPSPAAATPTMSEAAFAALLREADAANQTQTVVRYSAEASQAMRDGQLRHAGALAIETLTDRPQLADRRRIANTHFWELRDLRNGVRVYYAHGQAKEIVVLLVGRKSDQERDISRLPKIYERLQ